jgi:ParB-like chromosome segregation protein Spo0J
VPLDLPVDIIELLERGELSAAHGSALLIAKDPQARQELARQAVKEGWSTRVLQTHARESNSVVPAELQGLEGQAQPQDPQQVQDMTALNIARVWGDALGAEVMVRALPHRKLRVELLFDSPEGAFALGGKINEAIARGSKRR